MMARFYEKQSEFYARERERKRALASFDATTSILSPKVIMALAKLEILKENGYTPEEPAFKLAQEKAADAMLEDPSGSVKAPSEGPVSQFGRSSEA